MNRICTCNGQIKKLISAIQNLCLPLRPPWCSSLCLLTWKYLWSWRFVLLFSPGWERPMTLANSWKPNTHNTQKMFLTPPNTLTSTQFQFERVALNYVCSRFSKLIFCVQTLLWFASCAQLHPPLAHLPLHTIVPLVTKLTMVNLIHIKSNHNFFCLAMDFFFPFLTTQKHASIFNPIHGIHYLLMVRTPTSPSLFPQGFSFYRSP